VQLRDRRLTAFGRTEIAPGIRPPARKPGLEQDNGATGDAAVLPFEALKVVGSDLVVRTLRARPGDVDDAGASSDSSGIRSTESLPRAKCTGASMCVPPCSAEAKLLAE